MAEGEGTVLSTTRMQSARKELLKGFAPTSHRRSAVRQSVLKAPLHGLYLTHNSDRGNHHVNFTHIRCQPILQVSHISPSTNRQFLPRLAAYRRCSQIMCTHSHATQISSHQKTHHPISPIACRFLQMWVRHGACASVPCGWIRCCMDDRPIWISGLRDVVSGS